MKTTLRKLAAGAAATSFIALVPAVASSPAYAAATKTIVGQGAYLCQGKPDGFPVANYDITLRMSLTAPASVAPGQTVSLSGTATIQFDQKAYQEGRTMGVTEADGYSNTLSVATTANGNTTDVPANRWQTAPFPWRDPVVITAPITLHPFTVPANATGEVTITLPRNERRAPNLASNNPATVAFNGVANNKTAAGNISERLGCWLQGSGPSVIGTIPVARSGAPAADSKSNTASGTAVPPSATGRTPAKASAPASGRTGSAVPPAGSAPPSATAGPAGTPAVEGDLATASASGAAHPTETRSGVFVNTNLLILAGALICILSLGYALLANYRLRSITSAMDER